MSSSPNLYPWIHDTNINWCPSSPNLYPWIHDTNINWCPSSPNLYPWIHDTNINWCPSSPNLYPWIHDTNIQNTCAHFHEKCFLANTGAKKLQKEKRKLTNPVLPDEPSFARRTQFCPANPVLPENKCYSGKNSSGKINLILT